MTGKNWKVRNKEGKLLHGELTEKTIGICFDVHNQYGSGQKESFYQNALEEKLKASGLKYDREKSVKLKSVDTGEILGFHRLDFVIENRVVLETKAIKYTPKKLEQQLYLYLKNSKYKVGLMVNFGSSKLYIRRIIYTRNHPV